jgi:hypothetical protein
MGRLKVKLGFDDAACNVDEPAALQPCPARGQSSNEEICLDCEKKSRMAVLVGEPTLPAWGRSIGMAD